MKKVKINLEYFKYPASKIKTYYTLSKYNFSEIELSSNTPCIYITPKTAPIDEILISKCIKNKFVFLRDEIISKLSSNKLSQKEHDKLLKEIKTLTNEGFSFSILYGLSPTIFGKNEKLSEPLIFFLKSTNLDVKFLTFPGEYFAYPIWANKPRKSKIFACQQITVKQRYLEGLSKKEVIESFNNSIPSSATNYLLKYPITINSNELASGFEKVLYACPHCKKLFTIYSEYSCIKCRECGMVVEFSNDGKILFSNNLSSFDEIENYQYKCLTKNDLTVNKLIEYKNVIQIISENCKKQVKLNVILQVYAEYLIIKNSITNKKNTINYEDIEFIDYFYGNMIKIKTKNAKEFCFIGNSNENFFIIKDLMKLNKN